MTDFLSYVAACVGFVVVHPFLLLTLFILSFVAASIIIKKKDMIKFPKSVYVIAAALFITLFLNAFLGKFFLFKIIDKIGIESFGVAGEARYTGIRYNKRPLYEYDMYIYKNPKDSNDIIKVTFDDMFFPYYGKYSGYINRIPPIGTKVPIKYIKNFYRYFIILTDTTNPFISQELCQYYFSECGKKRLLYNSLKNAESAKEYYDAIKTSEKYNCDTLMFSLFKEDLIELERLLQRQ